MKNTHLLEHLAAFGGKRIAVVGDLMLDTYLHGRVTRISPEAPVPVVQVETIHSCLGGAANVMRNLATLGGTALAFGMVGADESGEEVRRQLAGYGIAADTVETDPDRMTTRKERVISGNQQMMRLDHEDISPAPAELRKTITQHLLKLIEAKAIDALIFEDYGKGLLDEVMLETLVPACRRQGIITALDPKPGNLAPVKGITVIKPNRGEAAVMAAMPEIRGDHNGSHLDKVAARLQELWEPEYLLISLAAEGMALYGLRGSKSVIPTRAREVYDVSGAGDTVVAAFTLALAAGASPEEAAEIGNYAAGIVVGKVGTVTVTAAELQSELESERKL